MESQSKDLAVPIAATEIGTVAGTKFELVVVNAQELKPYDLYIYMQWQGISHEFTSPPP